MIIRIVKMTFRPEEVETFRKIFHRNMNAIRSFEGVEKLELYRDPQAGNVFFTYSFWRSPDDLEKYRRSELFKSVWTETRKLFEEKAEAWSVEKLVAL